MVKENIRDIIKKRILVLDGGLGTMIQGFGLTEEDYRGAEFENWKIPLKGCNDLLVLTRPEVLSQIHEAYYLAGADIISTDTFNANSISLTDYGLQDYVYRINRGAAEIAAYLAAEFTARNPHKPRYVAGSVGPTSRPASMSTDVADPGARQVTFGELAGTYAEQVRGLLDGGADIIIIETFFDTLNAKAAIFAVQEEAAKRDRDIPMIISGTLGDASGRTLSGQTIEAFYTSVAHAEPLAVGLNCSYGAQQMLPYIERLSAVSEFPVSAHPNAGLPNLMGGYDETPEMMADDMTPYFEKGLLNILGGCCGTTPVHIARFSELAALYTPRPVRAKRHETVISGLEPLKIDNTANFINIGERTNVAGSAKFARLIREGNYEEAVGVARQQVDSGANIIDVCMDDGLIDGPKAMERFLNLMLSEPEIARIPLMIDSSSWEVLETGLRCVQGKSIVNSISLKEGEKDFLRRASLIRRYGAAAVVMLFDEKGQADNYERKIEVAGRAYRVLTESGFPPEDIIFDPNVLAIATGMEEHDNYGVDFIEAVRWIKANLPYCKVSGGVSNLSFSFRGNNKVREAMHSVFLYHAIQAGMDMGIVNPGMLQVYSEIEPELLTLVEDVVLNRRPDAAEKLTGYAETLKGDSAGMQSGKKEEEWRARTLAERISYAMKKGITDHIQEDISEAYGKERTPLGVIDNLLMPVMGEIGQLFGEGKMFLPQVVKSARVMKKAVDVLMPFMVASGGVGETNKAGKILIATVKGDVHDIGKNIVSVVMSCNGYDVKDLGVMVECSDIVNTAVEWEADVIGLSGLISPSLEEMIKVAAELENRGLDIPLIVGGATTSQLHTAVKIAPVYSGLVVQSRDASENITLLGKLFGENRDEYIRTVKENQEKLRTGFAGKEQRTEYLPLAEARENKYRKKVKDVVPVQEEGLLTFRDYPLAEVRKYIDWNFFFPAWGLKGKYPALLEDPGKGEEARKLYQDACRMLDIIEMEGLLRLEGTAGIFEARSEGDDIVVRYGEKEYRLAQLRNQEKQASPNGKGDDPLSSLNLSLADFILPGDEETKDHIALFALTAGRGLSELMSGFRSDGDEYNAIMVKLLADRLAEAFAEAVHSYIRREAWGFETGEPPVAADVLRGKYQGARLAFGYPACPDHSLKKEVFSILGDALPSGMELTGNYMISPGESLCGMIFADRDCRYFSVGRICSDQLEDYAARRGMTPGEIAAIIPQHLK